MRTGARVSLAGSRRWQVVLVAALAALAVGLLGTAATDLGPWYQSLVKPDWQPPDLIFGPAWTLIYTLWALSAATAWSAAASGAQRTRLVVLFGVNALLNVLWSELFFEWQRPDWALAELVVLWLSIVLLIVVLVPISRRASWLLVPYLAWVSFAGALNLAVVQLNAPFTPAAAG